MTKAKMKWFMTRFGGVAHSEHPEHPGHTDCGSVIHRAAGRYDSSFKCRVCATTRRNRAEKVSADAKAKREAEK